MLGVTRNEIRDSLLERVIRLRFHTKYYSPGLPAEPSTGTADIDQTFLNNYEAV